MKTTFTTKWGTFAYRCMPFGLINVGATFQRIMDEAFKGLIKKCIIIYTNYFRMFSKTRADHIVDLKQVLNRCHKYGISLNPKKCSFGVVKGKFLGHIISKTDISII